MSRDHKIQKINAYQRLLTTGKLPKVEEGDRVAQELNAEFKLWTESQIAVLLGESSATFGFSNEETEILKGFAQKLLTKAHSQPSANSSDVLAVESVPAPVRTALKRISEVVSGKGPQKPLHPDVQKEVERLERMERNLPESLRGE